MKSILVTSYENPDLDAVACIVAYAEFLEKSDKSAIGGVVGKQHDEARYVLDRFNLQYPQEISNADNFDEVVLVDASDIHDLKGADASVKIIEVIDHRKVNEADKFFNAKVQIELVGAAATLVAEKFIQSGVDISKGAATLLYAAIISNTLNFKGSVTTNRDREAAVWLNKIAELPESFSKDLFTAKSNLSGQKLAERIGSDFKKFTIGGKSVGIAQVEIIDAKKLLEERSDEIVQELYKIQKSQLLDYIFQNTLDLEDEKTFFVTNDIGTKELLERGLNVTFQGPVAERSGLILRKQVIPLLMQQFEQK